MSYFNRLVLRTDDHGNLTILPAIDGCDSSKLIETRDQFLRAHSDEKGAPDRPRPSMLPPGSSPH